MGVSVARVPAALTVAVAGSSAVLPAARRRKVAVVIVAAFIALLNEAVTVVLRGTPVAPGAGACTVTEIGRAAGRERGEISVGGVSFKKKTAAVAVAGETVTCANGAVGG